MGNTRLYVAENLSNHTGIRITGVRNTLSPLYTVLILSFLVIWDLSWPLIELRYPIQFSPDLAILLYLGLFNTCVTRVCVLSDAARNLNRNALLSRVQVVLRRRLDVIKSATKP